jgi:hypothetical protein
MVDDLRQLFEGAIMESVTTPSSAFSTPMRSNSPQPQIQTPVTPAPSQQQPVQYVLPVARILPLMKKHSGLFVDLDVDSNFANTLIMSELLADYSHLVFCGEVEYSR